MTVGRFLVGTQWQASRCVHTDTVESLQPIDASGDLPYFQQAPIDLHVHGAGGHDVMGGESSLRHVLKVQAQLGCGAMLATSVAAPDEAIDAFLDSVRAVMASPDRGSAMLLGAHLEGPFINPDKLGAQPPYAKGVDVVALERWLSTGVVRVITYAPEMDPEGVVPALCERHDVRAQIGHTLCESWQAHTALNAGCGVTHLWNAMTGATHRGGGVALTALAAAEYAEIIVDGIHVDRMAFLAATRAIPFVYVVTDGTAAVGMPDGQYRLGSHDVRRVGDRVELEDGTLAGSCLDQIRMCKVLREWGIDWRWIALRNCQFPANWIERFDLDQIAPGKRAQWLERQGETVVALWLDGERHEVRA